MFGLGSKNIGIDLGTANTLVYIEGKGIVLREPSVVAKNTQTGEVIAVGSEAKEMIGRTPGSIVAIRPMKDGVIADYDTTAAMLKYFMEKTVGNSKPAAMICVPSGVTEVEKRAVIDAARVAGAREAYVIEEPFAAAIGAGLPVMDPTGSMVVDIGGGTTDVATISLGGIVSSRSTRMAGDKFNSSIATYIHQNYNLLIGERTAETIVIDHGIVLTGGGALLKNLPEVISDATKVPVFIAQDPLDCVAIGTGESLKNIEVMRKRR